MSGQFAAVLKDDRMSWLMWEFYLDREAELAALPPLAQCSPLERDRWSQLRLVLENLRGDIEHMLGCRLTLES